MSRQMCQISIALKLSESFFIVFIRKAPNAVNICCTLIVSVHALTVKFNNSTVDKRNLSEL